MGKPKRGKKAPVVAYHDRVAGRYDQVYQGAYWKAYERISWEATKSHLPRDLALPVADLGCGTGLYGLKLLKSGFRVTFSDIATGMLERARKKAEELPGGASDRATFVIDDIATLEKLPADTFALVTAQGDPINHAGKRAPQAFKAIARILRPGGVLVASVDNAFAGLPHFLEKGDLGELERFLKDGMTSWLTKDASERFPVRMFQPGEIPKLLERAGLELLDLFGKPVLPLRRFANLLDDPDGFRRLLKLEKKLCREPSLLGGAAHLQLTARRPL